MNSDDTTVPNRPVTDADPAAIVVERGDLIDMMARLASDRKIQNDEIAVILVAPDRLKQQELAERVRKAGDGLTATQGGYMAVVCKQPAAIELYDEATNSTRGQMIASTMPKDKVLVLVFSGSDVSLMVGPNVQQVSGG